MNLYHKSILYGPDQEGSGSPHSELSAQEVSAPDTQVEINKPTSITEDPEYKRIKEEINTTWLSDTGVEPLSTQHQDYLFGNATDRSATTLEQDAERAFREQFPEQAQQYDENERVRVYDKISDDPAYKELNKRAISGTNTDKNVQAALKSGSRSDFSNSWARAGSSESVNAIFDFATQYPEKAQAYADRWNIYVSENPTTSEMSNEEWKVWCNERPDASSVDEYRRVARILEYVQKNKELQAQPINPEEIVSLESKAETEISLDALLGDLVGELQQEVEAANKPLFDTDPETGLSLEGKTVQEIQDRLIQLENRQAKDIEDLVNSETRIAQQAELRTILEAAKTNRDNTLVQITAVFDIALGKAQEKDPKFSMTLEQFIAKKDALQNIVDGNQKKVQEAEASLATFEVETKRLIDEAYEKELQATKDRLEPLKPEYEGSEAEKHDRQVILEQKLESLLTNPNALFSDASIAEILAVYGLQEGRDKIQQLRTESKKAQEKVDRDAIKKRYIENISNYTGRSYNPDLVLLKALNQDIQLKLEELQQTNPESENIKDAMRDIKRGLIDPGTLVNYRDPQLDQLVFWWHPNGRSNSDILTEYPHFAQYVDKKTDEWYKEEQQHIRSQRWGDRKYDGRRGEYLDADQRDELAFNDRISKQVEIAKKEGVDKIKREISTIQNSEPLSSQGYEDNNKLRQKEEVRRAYSDISDFKSELKKTVESRKVELPEGALINWYRTRGEEIYAESGQLLGKIKSLIESNDQIPIDIRTSLVDRFNTNYFTYENPSQITQRIQAAIIDRTSKKRFALGIGKKEVESLENLAKAVEGDIAQINTLQEEQKTNKSKYRSNMSTLDNLDALSRKLLPKFIKEKVGNIGKYSSIDSINEAINNAIQELQSYETPAELKAQRDKIAELQKQIEELNAIK